MPDAPVVHIGENTPEYVALLLMRTIDEAEGSPKRDRNQILALYADCLRATKGIRVDPVPQRR